MFPYPDFTFMSRHYILIRICANSVTYSNSKDGNAVRSRQRAAIDLILLNLLLGVSLAHPPGSGVTPHT